MDIVNALVESGKTNIKVIGGRYGLSSKEFTPAMVKATLDELKKKEPKNHFTVGITDDVSHTSLEVDSSFAIESDETIRCVFFGLGSDGTVGANKNSIKIIGEETSNFAQGYFYYDSKKSGTVTISHLRFGPKPIHAAYLIEQNQANFVACHQFTFLERVDMLKYAKPGSGLPAQQSCTTRMRSGTSYHAKSSKTSSRRNSSSTSSTATMWPKRRAWAGA